MPLRVATSYQNRALVIAAEKPNPKANFEPTRPARPAGATLLALAPQLVVSLRDSAPIGAPARVPARELNEARKLWRSAVAQFEQWQRAIEETRDLRAEIDRLSNELLKLRPGLEQPPEWTEEAAETLLGELHPRDRTSAAEIERRMAEIDARLNQAYRDLKAKTLELEEMAPRMGETLNGMRMHAGNDPQIDKLLNNLLWAPPEEGRRKLDEVGRLLDQRWENARLIESVWMGRVGGSSVIASQ